jgi:hypothetical protein
MSLLDYIIHTHGLLVLVLVLVINEIITGVKNVRAK